MSKYKKNIVREVNSIGERYGVTFARFIDGRSHLKVVLRHSGETRYVTTGYTPSDGRAAANHRANVRRACRELVNL